MQTVVIGVGYTGRRVVSLLPAGEVTGVTRSTLDLDQPTPDKPVLPASYALLYTVPPRDDADGDPRLARLLALLDPVPARFVYLSTSGVYGDRGGDIVTEQDEPRPETDRARRRLAAEKLLASWCSRSGCDLVILRVPGIYGPGRLGLDRIRAGVPLIAEAEAQPGNRIHVDDLAACCIRALQREAPPGIYNVGDGDHCSTTAFSLAVAAIAGLDPPPRIPFAEALRTFSESRLSFLRESRVVDTTRMREVLGFSPRYASVADGIRASLD